MVCLFISFSLFFWFTPRILFMKLVVGCDNNTKKTALTIARKVNVTRCFFNYSHTVCLLNRSTRPKACACKTHIIAHMHIWNFAHSFTYAIWASSYVDGWLALLNCAICGLFDALIVAYMICEYVMCGDVDYGHVCVVDFGLGCVWAKCGVSLSWWLKFKSNIYMCVWVWWTKMHAIAIGGAAVFD